MAVRALERGKACAGRGYNELVQGLPRCARQNVLLQIPGKPLEQGLPRTARESVLEPTIGRARAGFAALAGPPCRPPASTWAGRSSGGTGSKGDYAGPDRHLRRMTYHRRGLFAVPTIVGAGSALRSVSVVLPHTAGEFMIAPTPVGSLGLGYRIPSG